MHAKIIVLLKESPDLRKSQRNNNEFNNTDYSKTNPILSDRCRGYRRALKRKEEANERENQNDLYQSISEGD